MTATIDDLPDELLDHILSIVSPYKDLDCCKLVSRKWHNAMKRVVRRKKCSLVNALINNKLIWEFENCEGLSLRYAHASCYHDGTLYIFGGFSKNHNTAFNDLLAFDLTARVWKRIQATGDFPQPKAGASLSAHKDRLILYGGCTRSAFNPCIAFGELHTFDLKTNKWTIVSDPYCGLPAFACHSATIHGNKLLINGGMEARSQLNNQTYCLDLGAMTITSPRCLGTKPPPIYCGSQIYIDENHLLLTGGWLEIGIPQPNQTSWLLSMEQYPWHWTNVTHENLQWVPLKRACFTPAISKVGDYLVALSAVDELESGLRIKQEDPRALIIEEPEDNVNGVRGILRRKMDVDNTLKRDRPGHLFLAPDERRQQRLNVLSKFEKKYAAEEVKPKPKKCSDMALYVGYIGDIQKTLKIVWKEPRILPGPPSSRVLYSQTVGKSEIILFGGLCWNGRERSEELPLVEENALAIVKAPRTFL